MKTNGYQNNQYTSVQKLRVVLILLVFLVSIGTTGFIFIENMNLLDALYMTFITFSTVGFSEVAPLHPGGRIFVIFLIVIGLGLAYYLASIIGQMVIEGQFKEILGRRKMDNKIKKLNEHHIIAGYGRVGRRVASEFKKRNAPFIVIEKDQKAIDSLFSDQVLFVEGEATDDEVLRQARIEVARTLISTLPDEAQNVYITLTAREMNRNLKIISRADFDEGEKKLKRAGADQVISPHVLGGMRMAMACLRPNVVDFMHTTSLGEGGLSIEEMVIPDGSSLIGKTLVESRLKQDFGANIIGLKKPGENMMIAPGPNTILDKEDIMVLIGHADGLERLSKTTS